VSIVSCISAARGKHAPGARNNAAPNGEQLNRLYLQIVSTQPRAWCCIRNYFFAVWTARTFSGRHRLDHEPRRRLALYSAWTLLERTHGLAGCARLRRFTSPGNHIDTERNTWSGSGCLKMLVPRLRPIARNIRGAAGRLRVGGVSAVSPDFPHSVPFRDKDSRRTSSHRELTERKAARPCGSPGGPCQPQLHPD